MLLCLSLVGLVLLQQGKGAGMGAAFGGANSQTVFGAAGAGNVLTKVTTSIAICFMVTSIILVRHYGKLVESNGVMTIDPLEGSVLNHGAVAKVDTSTEESAAPKAESEGDGSKSTEAVAPANPEGSAQQESQPSGK